MHPTAERAPITGQFPELNRELREVTDVTTWLAEVLNGSMRTSFEFGIDGDVLRGEDGGSMDEVFDDSIEAAQVIARENPSLLFELRRRLIERGELDDMYGMIKGEQPNTMITVSDFPPELMGASEDVGGYNVNRKQTMLRLITHGPEGTVRVITRSLDGSNRKALEAIYAAMGEPVQEGELLGQRIHRDLPPEWQDKLEDILTDAYDDSLAGQHGGSWHAGIRQPDKRATVNTYQFAAAQEDLVSLFVAERLRDPRGAEKLRFGLAATAKERYEKFISRYNQPDTAFVGEFSPSAFVSSEGIARAKHELYQEMSRAETRAAARGETFSGCGSSVSAEETSTEDQLQALGYGNKKEFSAGRDKFGLLKFKCPKGHENIRPRNQLIDCCKTCGTSVKC